MSLGTITAVLNRIMIKEGRPQVSALVVACQAGGAGDGNAHLFPSTELVAYLLGLIPAFDIRGLQLYSIKIIPDAVTPPTNGSSLTLTDEYGIDLLGGRGSGLISNTTPAWSLVGTAANIVSALITGQLNLNITGNSVNGAKLTVVIETIGV